MVLPLVRLVQVLCVVSGNPFVLQTASPLCTPNWFTLKLDQRTNGCYNYIHHSCLPDIDKYVHTYTSLA